MSNILIGENDDATIRLAGVVQDSIVDGYGIRMSIFAQGCPHNCKGCHNPQSHSFTGGYEEKISSLYEKCSTNPLLKGITLSGGEPFCQAEAFIPLCKAVKKIGMDVWAYTGYTYEALVANVVPYGKELLSLVDVLVDGPFVEGSLNLLLWYRGSENQRVIDVKKTIESGNISEIIFDE